MNPRPAAIDGLLVLLFVLVAQIFAAQALAVEGTSVGSPINLAGASGPALVLDGGSWALPGRLATVPIAFWNNGHTITSMALSIDLDTDRLDFDPTDANGDGIPDAVDLPAGVPQLVVVDYDADDTDGELDILLANLSGAPLPEGVVVVIEAVPREAGAVARAVEFSSDPEASFGNDLGQDVEGTTVVLGLDLLFADGFESGDTGAWPATVP